MARVQSLIALGFLGVLLLGGSSPTRAQSAKAVALDIDACPGLAGQPLTRRDLISEYISIPSIAHPAGTPAVLDRVQFIRIRERSADPHKVDAVLLQAIPNGGGGISEMGTQVVETAARSHKNFELWIIERRERNTARSAGRAPRSSRSPRTTCRSWPTGTRARLSGTRRADPDRRPALAQLRRGRRADAGRYRQIHR